MRLYRLCFNPSLGKKLIRLSGYKYLSRKMTDKEEADIFAEEKEKTEENGDNEGQSEDIDEEKKETEENGDNDEGQSEDIDKTSKPSGSYFYHFHNNGNNR